MQANPHETVETVETVLKKPLIENFIFVRCERYLLVTYGRYLE